MGMSVTVEIKSWPDGKEVDWRISGGDDRNLTWEEYLSEVMDEYKGHFIALKEYIEKSEYYKATGGSFCNDFYWEFSDGITASFSFRAWGDLMQAIVGKREGYMAYYC